MAQAVEAKLRKISKSEKHFEWAKSELDANEKGYAKMKLDVICELASKLEEEGEIETNRISTEIAKRLREYVTQRYVNEVLDGRYKDEKHVESAKSRRTSSAKTKRAAAAALTADVSEADIIAEDEPPQKQEGAPPALTAHVSRKSVKYTKLEDLRNENSKLKEALKRHTTNVNQIRFIVPQEKFNQLKKAMEICRDSIRLVFDKSGMLERAESDVY
jgi:hypothetical protein